MDTEVKNTISAEEQEAQYDASAKRLLSQKIILAHILVSTVDDFKNMTPKEAAECIEGDPKIGSVPVEPGHTNQKHNGGKIAGLNGESAEHNEGLIRFDIVFYVRLKDGLSQIIINVEAQKDEPSKYQIINRAIFYASRLISSQKERDFVNSEYDNIKKVYSIWVCMNMRDNTLNHIHLTDDKKIGSYTWDGKLDLFNIVMIGLGVSIPEHDETYELHRLLGALLSMDLTAEEKLNIMEQEYKIPMEQKLEEGVKVMCNLSQGIKEAGIAVGEKRGMEKGIAEGIRATVEICQEDGKTLDSTFMRIKEKFSLSQEDATRYVKRFWK